MIERDYIMRMIQMLVQVLARILFRKKGEQYPEALDEIQKGSKQVLGIELDIFRRLSDKQMIDMLLLDVGLGIPKCFAAGMLLKEEGEILEAQKKMEEVGDIYAKSLSLLTEAAIRNTGVFNAGHAEAIDFLIGKVAKELIAVHTEKKLFHYLEMAGHFSKATEMLQDIVMKEPSFVQEGIKFHERLRKKTDEELSQGDLSRKDVEGGMEDLEQR